MPAQAANRLRRATVTSRPAGPGLQRSAWRVVPMAELRPSDVAAWRDLAARAAEPNPFYEPEAMLPALAYLGAEPAGLLVVERGGRWTACLPLQARVGRRTGLFVRSWLHVYAFFGMPLVDAEDPVMALGDVLDAAVQASITGAVVLDGLPADGVAGRILRAAMAQRGLVPVFTRSHERAALVRRPGGGYLDHVRSHHRREWNRLARRLEETLAAPLTVVDCGGDSDAVETFLRLEESGWKGREGTAMASLPGHADYFRELCRSFHDRGRLQLLALRAGERTVAMKCNLAAGPVVYCFKIAQDHEFDRFSPGVALERANVTIFHDDRPEEWMDSCAAPDNVMINRLWPDRRGVTTMVIGRRTLRTGAVAVTVRIARGLRSRARALATQKRSIP